ncbi:MULTISPECIES: FAD binding domain-containing protein [unclassified Mesorhizobium]|uniref:FAD binding domain-containing protein n=1 Tax=unclassified Mesorhizobium TaxID=325217 RepID=UPI00112880A9|nr:MULTISPECIES: FAD binding domain-containing protein [unclassified Mesorhizobium]MBZ9810996.1 FAD binding domain-containing protein [Mesorhizobium sp. ESP-6-2]TPM27775.1 carbon monoxide dehydrogenase [Mesorhizobium sp. B2-2-2]
MKAVNFDYARPAEISAAIALLVDDTRSAKLMAGSQSLGPMLNMRLVQPDLIVDITGIGALRSVREESDSIVVGACVTHADFEDCRVPDVTRGAMPSVARGIAYRAVRNRGTIGGSITHADPSADWISILSALGAKVTLQGPQGSRVLAVEDYMLGALEADLRHGEMLVSVTIPKLSPGARWGYYKSCRKTGEFAHAIGAFLLDPQRKLSRAVIGATESRPFVVPDARHLIGDGTAKNLIDGFDREATAKMAQESGMSDEIERRSHVVALRRAIEQARP